MALMEILDRLRTKKSEAKKAQGSEYLALVRAVASGDEVDAASAIEIIADSGKTDDDFEADCQKQSRRYEQVQALANLQKVVDSLPALRATHEAAVQAYNEACDRLKPVIGKAWQALSAAEMAILPIDRLRDELRETVLDESIIQRKKEIAVERKQLRIKTQPIIEDRDLAAARVRSLEGKIASLKRDAGELDRSDLMGRSKNRSAIEAAEARIPALKASLAQLETILAELDKQRFELDDEMLEIDRQSLEA